MSAIVAERIQAAAVDVHSALDSLLPKLRSDELGRLAHDLALLADRPTVLLEALSFACTLMRENPIVEAATPALRLTGGGHGALIDEGKGVRRLEAIIESSEPETWAQSDLLGPEAIVERLGVSRSTLHNWRRDGRVIALRKGLRNHVYPVRQFAGAAPLAGIAEILAVMGDAEETWEWLVTPNTYTGGKPPIAWLEGGQVDAVRHAADSALDYA